jgi:hypothetical protein
MIIYPNFYLHKEFDCEKEFDSRTLTADFAATFYVKKIELLKNRQKHLVKYFKLKNNFQNKNYIKHFNSIL